MSPAKRRNPGRPKGSRDKQPRKRKDPATSRAQTRADADGPEQALTDQGAFKRRAARDATAPPSPPPPGSGGCGLQQALFENLQALLGRNRAAYAAIGLERVRSAPVADVPSPPPPPPPLSSTLEEAPTAGVECEGPTAHGRSAWDIAQSSDGADAASDATADMQAADGDAVLACAAVPPPETAVAGPVAGPPTWGAAAAWPAGPLCAAGGKGASGEDPFHSDWPFW